MSRNKNKDKKTNLPYYMKNNDMVKVDEKIKEKIENNQPIKISKFRLGIDKNNNPLITIDNVLHFMDSKQFHAFTLGIINISKKVNPEIDYSKILINSDSNEF